MSTIEALLAALAEGWRAEVVSDGDVRVYQPGGHSWLFIRTDKSDEDKLVHGLATVFAAACNAAPELLAERDALRAALSFYADETRYDGPNQRQDGPDAWSEQVGLTAYRLDVTRDRGVIARAALKERT